jgi:hypothetical protein
MACNPASSLHYAPMKSILVFAGISLVSAAAIVPAVRFAQPPAFRQPARLAQAKALDRALAMAPDCESLAAPLPFVPVVFVPPHVGLPFLPAINCCSVWDEPSVLLVIDSSTSGEALPPSYWQYDPTCSCFKHGDIIGEFAAPPPRLMIPFVPLSRSPLEVDPGTSGAVPPGYGYGDWGAVPPPKVCLPFIPFSGVALETEPNGSGDFPPSWWVIPCGCYPNRMNHSEVDCP